MRTFLWIMLALTFAAIFAVAYFMIKGVSKRSRQKEIKSEEIFGEASEAERKTARAVRGDDIWTISVYPSGGAKSGSPAIKSAELTVLPFVYDKPRKKYGIGIDSKGNVQFDCTENAEAYITFYQDLGMCLVGQKSEGEVGLTDALTYRLGSYDLVFTYEDKRYRGVNDKKADRKKLTDSIDVVETEGAIPVGESSKAFKKQSKKFAKSFADWFRKNI